MLCTGPCLIPGSRSAGPRGLQSCCALGPHIKGRAHGPCRNGPCMMGGHAVQVLFDSQGRSTKNKSVDLEDIKFHQCVRLTRFENDRTISFIPPDGNFDLM